jgi:restriction endonuclease S subunit
MQLQTLKLENITTSIQYGPHLKTVKDGDVKYLVSSHFNEQLKPSYFKDSYLQSSNKINKYLLQENDVLLTGKGNRLFAWAYNPKYGKVIPSSLFYALKLDESRINGAYLAEVLNSDKVQHQLRLIGSGATILSIAKGELMQIKVPVPPLVEQLKIVETVNSLDHNIELTQSLLNQKITLKRGVINKILNQQK